MVVRDIRVINPTVYVHVIQMDRVSRRRLTMKTLPYDVRDVFELASWYMVNVEPLPRPLGIRINGVNVDEDDLGNLFYFDHNDIIEFFEEK